VVGADGVLERRKVTTGLRTATDVEILQGLEESETVVTANTAAFPGRSDSGNCGEITVIQVVWEDFSACSDGSGPA
jgi:hypothetical protein